MRIRTHTNPFNCNNRLEKVDFFEVFNNYKGKLDLEIGFGRGVFIRNYARKHPDKCIIGAEIRKQIVQVLDQRIKKEEIENIYIVNSTGEICMEDIIDDGIIENLFIFHPDPWFKKKHNKRRIINQSFLDLTVKKLSKEGKLYISTDVKELWDYINEEITRHGKLNYLDKSSFFENYYETHWADFSQKDSRDVFYGAFTLK
ncbi:MAG: tRNA (guanosine(46)-N7)-methyltransferase TrmB [bacterium]|nr:tRNA (guanosine(46)-N7)-methyltransferase TrmB [bacterium]